VFEKLPETINVEPGVRKGRVPRDGYARGWGLQYGTAREIVENDPLFKYALDNIGLPSLTAPDKRANLYLIITRYLTNLADRNVIEFGAFKGGTSIFMALVLREIAPEAMVYALDTFSGMPKGDGGIDAHGEGDYAETSLDDLLKRIQALDLSNLIPIKGLFQDTFDMIPKTVKFGLAHIDGNIYSSIKYAQDAVWPRMTTGGYVAYDNADLSSCAGATEAAEELIQERKVHTEQVWPHFVFRAGL